MNVEKENKNINEIFLKKLDSKELEKHILKTEYYLATVVNSYRNAIDSYYENPSEEYLKDEIILPIYPQAGELKISIGQLNYFRNEKIFYTIESGFGAAGGPIILKNRNYKVIGIHKAMRKKDGKKMGLSIKYIMDDINKVTGFNG